MKLAGCASKLLACRDAEIRFRVQDGELREVAESTQRMTVILYVSEKLNEALFTIKVIETGQMLRDEIAIEVVRQPADSRRLRFRVFLGGAVR